MVTMETVIFEQNSYYFSISCTIFNLKFLNIFLIQNIDDNWRYNVVWHIYYVIYNRYIICWVPLNPFSLFRIYHDRISAIVFLMTIFISRGAEGPGREILQRPPSVRLSVRPSVRLSVCLSVRHV